MGYKVNFHLSHCEFQDLTTGSVISNVKGKNGLHYLSKETAFSRKGFKSKSKSICDSIESDSNVILITTYVSCILIYSE